MEKYEHHGLTRAQDNILGAFGTSDDLSDTCPIDSLSPEQLEAAKQLIGKGLLVTYVCEDFSIELRLTPKGKKLHRIRSEEESESPPIAPPMKIAGQITDGTP